MLDGAGDSNPGRGQAGAAARTILALPPERRAAALARLLSEVLARALGETGPEGPEGINPADIPQDRPLAGLGLDSLATVELQHSLEQSLGFSPSAADLLEAPGVAALAAGLLARLEAGEA